VTSEWTIHYHTFWKTGEKAPTRLDEMITFLGWKDEELKKRERARRLGDISGTACRANGYRQDRAGMRSMTTFSGLKNVVLEDIAVTETMGAISNRSIEHLVQSDAAVIRARRVLVRNARKVEQGEQPGGTDLQIVPAGGQGFVTEGNPWSSFFDDWSNVVAEMPLANAAE
jgi:phthalate 4,5-dioxygenase